LKNIATWLPFAVVCLGILYAIVVRRALSRQRSVDELTLLLRHIDLPLLEQLLDPEEEAALRQSKSARAFRDLQIGRMAAAFEHLRRVLHNAAAFRRWGAAEFKKIAHKNRAQFGPRDQLIVEVIRYATEVRKHALCAAVKIMVWRALAIARWSVLPSPSLSDIREVLGVDWLHQYEQLTAAAAQLMHDDGPDCYDRLLAAL
jgi:hypothetical protein